MTNHKPPITNNLLSFCEVGNITFIIDPTCKISSTLFFIRSTTYQCIYYILFCCYWALILFNVTLDYGLAPVIDTLLLGYLHQGFVEDELAVKFALFDVLLGSYVEVVGCVQSVIVTVVVAPIIEQFGHVLNLILITIQHSLQLLPPHNRNPINFLYLEHRSLTNITT